MSGSSFEVYEDAEGGWRWRLIAANGEPLAQGESYTRKEDAVRAVKAIASAAAEADVEVLP